VCEPRTKEQLVALLDVGDFAFQGTLALPQSLLRAKVCCKGNYVCEVRVFKEGIWRIVASIADAVWVREGHRVGRRSVLVIVY
jgi:hypothetical protein